MKKRTGYIIAKALAFAAALLLCVILLPTTDAQAAEIVDSGECGADLTWTLDSEGTLTISGKGEMLDYSPWYNKKEAIQIVVIEYGVTRIGSYAFGDCSSLKSVIVPNSVTSIGADAFHGCSSLISVTIPSGATSIETATFYGCSSLISVTIPHSVTSIGTAAFCGCSSLEGITIPGSVTSIGANAFSGCGNLMSVSIQDGVSSIEFGAFYGCNRLKDLAIPGSVKSIGFIAFSGCSSLKNVTIGNGVVSIQSNAFFGCYNLNSLTLPNTLQELGLGLFIDCNKLENVYFNGTFLQLFRLACTNSNSEIFHATVHYCSIGSVAEQVNEGNCGDSLTWRLDVEGKLKINGAGAMWDFGVSQAPWYSKENVVHVEIEDGMTSIGTNAFCYEEGQRQLLLSPLWTIVIPESVKSIGDGAFNGCMILKDVYYSGNEEQWSEISVGTNNDLLFCATVHFNSTGPDSVHTFTYCPAVDADCEKNGTSEYWHCDICDKYFADEAPTVIPAPGHDWGIWQDDGEGGETRTCGRCGKTETRYGPMLTAATATESDGESAATVELAAPADKALTAYGARYSADHKLLGLVPLSLSPGQTGTLTVPFGDGSYVVMFFLDGGGSYAPLCRSARVERP